MNTQTEVEQPTQKSTDVALSHRIFVFFGLHFLIFLVISISRSAGLNHLHNGLYGLISIGFFLTCLGIVLFALYTPSYLILGILQFCIRDAHYKWALYKTREDILNTFGVVVAYGLLVLYFVLVVPHCVASLYLESTWQRWIKTKDSAEFRIRDQILDTINFETETSFREWDSNKEAVYPGIYLPYWIIHPGEQK